MSYGVGVRDVYLALFTILKVDKDVMMPSAIIKSDGRQTSW